MGAMLNFTSSKRPQINLVFQIKVFVVSQKFGILINPFIFIFPKFWVVTV
jgi:hypothetical protein